MFDMESVNRRTVEPGLGGREQRAGSDSVAGYGADAEGWRLICVSLFGGAPWGFTLRGGLEHGEPLLITKVEDGSKAASVRLQVGDELVNINDFPLSGYRQEAICLVKGSHKTLTLVVKRKNEPMIRPHSWHATKFTENQADAGKTQSAPSPVWQTRYDASTFTSDLAPGWDQTNLRRVSDQFSSLGSMDSLEHGNHPYPAGRLSPNKSNGNSVEHLTGGKRDSAYSSFSTSSGTPDYTLSKSNTASTENMLYKVNQWESGNRPSNGRHTHSLSEGLRQDDRVAYVQLSAGRDSPRGGAEEQPGYRHSASGRSNIGPVWHVPDMRKNTDPSPPPPAPPLRSDSFAATKIHEKGLIPGYVGGHALSKPQVKGLEMAPEFSEGIHRGYRSAEPGPEPLPSDAYNPNRPDVVGHPPHPRPAYHKRQYSDESMFYPSSRSGANKPPNANCYSSMQELPTNHQNQVQKTAPPQNSAAPEQNLENYRPYSVKARQHSQSQAPTARLEDRNASLGLETIQSGGDRTSVSSQGSNRERYNAPQNHNKDSNGLYGQHQGYTAGRRLEPGAKEFREVQKHNAVMNPSFGNFPHPEISQPRSQDPPPDHFPSRNEAVWPPNVPGMHSHDHTQADLVSGNGDMEYFDPQKGRSVRRNDRFATTLRNEIQIRRAHLQKSQSSAGLSEVAEPEEESPAWKPSADGSFTITYKDHLKEAQARVLKATSFRRRDLEPVLLEHPGAEATPTALRKESPSLASVSEVPSSRAAPGGNHVPRIGGRKRFPVEKKTRSYSEPDKINSVGVQESYAQENAESVASRRKVFEATAKPAYCKPVPKQSPPVFEEPQPAQSDGTTLYGPADSAHRLGTFAEYEATWNTQRSAADPRTSGRYHSADNILDSGADERHKPLYFHERSRSSPSEDFYGPQNIVVQGRKSAEYPAPVRTHGNHDESRSRLSDGAPRNLGAKQNQGDAEEKRTSRSPPNPAGPPLQFPDRGSVLTESSSYSKSKRPPPPPKRPEVTAPPVAASISSSSSPIKHIIPVPGPRNEAEPQAGTPPQPPNRLTPPGMDIQRSPSPHFAPQRLTDKPPASVSRQDEAAGRMDQVSDENSAVRKVPIKIVHSESDTDKENRLYLYPSADNPPDTPEPPVLSPLSSLGTPQQQSSSPFCTYTRQREQENETMGVTTDEPRTDPGVDDEGGAAEDEKREGLARDIIDKDKSLADILDQSKRRTTMDLMEGLFPQGEELVEMAHQRRMAAPKLTSSRSMEERKEEDSMAAAAALVTSSAYYSTSAPKAELLIKMKDMQEQSVELESEEELEEENDTELAGKKDSNRKVIKHHRKRDILTEHELIESLSKKLQVLREARESLQEDVQDNNALGEEVEAIVQKVCKPNELEKFRMFVGDLDKVVSLLLSLSGRLARVENALNSLEEDAPLEERRTLMDKRKLLIRQHEDAKELKENLDRREKAVQDILCSYLQEESLADYEHFVKMKSALIIEQRKLEDKIKLGEEQLKCLMDSLPPEQRPRY